MWEVKVFKTASALKLFIEKNSHRLEWHYIYVNNAYGIEYRKLRFL